MKCVWNVSKRIYRIRAEEGLTKYMLFEVTTFGIITKISVNLYTGKAHSITPGGEKHKCPCR